jgi:hypothetical protein
MRAGISPSSPPLARSSSRSAATGGTRDRAGTYHLFCTQLCGVGHATMAGEIVVMPAPRYQEWLERRSLHYFRQPAA